MPGLPGDRAIKFGDASVAVPEIREDGAGGATGPGRSAGRRALLRCRAGAGRGLRHRISRARPRSSPSTLAGCAPRHACPRARPCSAAKRWASHFRPERLSLFDGQSGRALRTALTGGMAMAESRPGVAKRFGDVGRWASFPSSSPTANSSCSGPYGRRQDHDTAPHRRPREARSRHDPHRRPRRHAPPARTRDVAFVFQQYSLYPHLSVFDNLAFPLRSPVRRVPEGEIRKGRGDGELLHIPQARQSGDQAFRR